MSARVVHAFGWPSSPSPPKSNVVITDGNDDAAPSSGASNSGASTHQSTATGNWSPASIFSSTGLHDANAWCTAIQQDPATALKELSKLAASAESEGRLMEKEQGRAPNPALLSDLRALREHGDAGVTPVMVAAFAGQHQLVAKLLDLGAQVDLTIQPAATSEHIRKQQSLFPGYAHVQGLSPVQLAVLGGDKATIALLVERGGEGVKEAERPSPPPYEAMPGMRGMPKQQQNPVLTLEHLAGLSRPVLATTGAEKNRMKEEILAAIAEGRRRYQDRLKWLRQSFPLEMRLSQHLVGQIPAIQAVSSAVRRKENGWFDTDSPLVLLFMGSSGIGKTKTAKLIAEYLTEVHPPKETDAASGNATAGGGIGQAVSRLLPHLSSSDKSTTGASGSSPSKPGKSQNPCFIRLDMTEYQHEHEVSKFIGAPPGYVGFQQGGQLVSKLEKCPNAVVLLDEVEKAHPDVLTVMLQAFDEGRLTDGQGKEVDCREATFIMTSNLAQREIADEAVRLRQAHPMLHSTAALQDASGAAASVVAAAMDVNGKAATATTSNSNKASFELSSQFRRHVIQPILRAHFGRDEFIGRINDIVYFLPFDAAEVEELATRELQDWGKRAAQKHDVSLSWSPSVVKQMSKGYDLRFGARSVKYEIDRTCIAALARAQEEGAIKRGCHVEMVLAEDAARLDPTTEEEELKVALVDASNEPSAPLLEKDTPVSKNARPWYREGPIKLWISDGPINLNNNNNHQGGGSNGLWGLFGR